MLREKNNVIYYTVKTGKYIKNINERKVALHSKGVQCVGTYKLMNT